MIAKIRRALSRGTSKSLFVKSFLLIFILVNVPVLAISVVIFQYSNRVLINEIGSNNEKNLLRIRDLTDSIFHESDMMASKIMLDSSVQIFMLSEEPATLVNNLNQNVQKLLSDYSDIYKYIDSIYVYSSISHHVITNNYIRSFDEFDDQTWIDDYRNRMNSASGWIQPRKRNETYPYFISLIKPAVFNSSESLGAILVNIDVEEFGKMIGSTGNELFENLFIVDADDKILYNNDLSKLNSSILNQPLFQTVSLEGREAPSSVIAFQNNQYILSLVNSQNSKWRFVSVMPLKHYAQKMDSLRSFLILLFIGGLLVTIIVSFVISSRSLLPIKKIADLFQNPENWRERRQTGLENTWEFANIANRLMHVLDSKKELEAELERRLSLLVKAQSAALKAQINPHFLYNTLDSIKWTAIRLWKNENKVSDMVSDLSELLRLSVNEQHLIPVRQEIEHAKLYVNIMEWRFKEKLSVHFELDEAIMDKMTVQLTLQPLIENAFQHGIRPTLRKGTIRITGRIAEEKLIFEVSDDGMGMSEAQVNELNDRLGNQFELDGRHIGLSNANQRIQLLFSREFGIRISSALQEGARATITLPVILAPE